MSYQAHGCTPYTGAAEVTGYNSSNYSCLQAKFYAISLKTTWLRSIYISQLASSPEDISSEPMRDFCFPGLVCFLCHHHHRTRLHESEAIISSSRGRFPFAFTKLQENLTGCCMSAPSIDHPIIATNRKKFRICSGLNTNKYEPLVSQHLRVCQLSLTRAAFYLLHLLSWNRVVQSESSLQTKDDFFAKYVIPLFRKR